MTSVYVVSPVPATCCSSCFAFAASASAAICTTYAPLALTAASPEAAVVSFGGAFAFAVSGFLAAALVGGAVSVTAATGGALLAAVSAFAAGSGRPLIGRISACF